MLIRFYGSSGWRSCLPRRRFRTHASITARLFFEKRGFQIVKEQTVKRNGVEMMNYVMVKGRKGQGEYRDGICI